MKRISLSKPKKGSQRAEFLCCLFFQVYAEYTGMRLLVSLDPVQSSFVGNKRVECWCGVHLPVKMTDKRHLKENRRISQNRDSSCFVPAKRLTMCVHESLLAPEHWPPNARSCGWEGKAVGMITSASFFQLTVSCPWAPVPLNLKSLLQRRL